MQTVRSANEGGRRQLLKRFGYGLGDAAAKAEAGWTLLHADFAPGVPIPALSAMDPRTRLLVEGYLDRRARLDVLMDSCDAAHLRILQEGARPTLVEAYAGARDAYEDAVEDFGAHRERVQKALASAAARPATGSDASPLD